MVKNVGNNLIICLAGLFICIKAFPVFVHNWLFLDYQTVQMRSIDTNCVESEIYGEWEKPGWVTALAWQAKGSPYINGMNALDCDDYDMAIENLSIALGAGQKFAAGPLGLAVWLQGEQQTAVEYWQESDEAIAWLRSRALEVSEPAQQIWWWEIMLQARPNDLRTNTELSFLYAGDYQNCQVASECIRRLEQAMTVPYPSITLIQILSRYYINANRQVDALELVDKALQNYEAIDTPYKSTLHALRAESLRTLNRQDEAVLEYQNALSLSPQHVSWRLKFAEMLVEMNLCQAARFEYDIGKDIGIVSESDHRLAKRISDMLVVCSE